MLHSKISVNHALLMTVLNSVNKLLEEPATQRAVTKHMQETEQLTWLTESAVGAHTPLTSVSGLVQKMISAELAAAKHPTRIGSMGSMSTAQAICEHKEITCVHLFLRACLASSAWQIDDLGMHIP